MKKVLALPVIATVIVLLVLQTALPIQPSDAVSRITVPRDYPTIQSAIDAANPGDTIKVLPGTYTEQLTISKGLTLVGSGDKVTTIKAPTILPGTTVNGDPYIIDIREGANVNMKGFTISGLSTSTCPDLVGINVMESSELTLASSTIKNCTGNGIFAEGDVSVTQTNVIDYQDHGIFGFGTGSLIKVSYSKLVGDQNSEIPGSIGILLVQGKGIIENNKISNNLCNLSECGPDFLTQFQAFAIVTAGAKSGTILSQNIISNNDGGIAVVGNNGCCKIDDNFLSKNRYYGITIVDGKHTVSNTIIYGGNVGVAAIAFEIDTVATLDKVLIKGATTPTQELPVGASAEVVIKKPPVKGLDLQLDKLNKYLDSIDNLIGSIL